MISVAFSPSLYTHTDLNRLIEIGVKRFYVPFYTPEWVARFGRYIQPSIAPEPDPTHPDVFAEIAKTVHGANGELACILDGHLSSPAEQRWVVDALTFLNDIRVREVVVSNPALPISLGPQFPHLSWIVASSALVYSVQTVAFWADIGAYRVHLPGQISGAEAFSLIHYSSHLPVKFTLPLLAHPNHQLDGGCQMDCDWLSPSICHTPKRQWLETDIAADMSAINTLLKQPDSTVSWETIPPDVRLSYAQRSGEPYASETAFSPLMPMKCGACFLPKLQTIPALEYYIHGTRLNPTTILRGVTWIQDNLGEKNLTPDHIQKTLGLAGMCNTRKWCLYPDQVEAKS